MKCSKCGYRGRWERAIVLTLRIPADEKGNPILSDFTKNDIPFGSIKKWIEDEANSQIVEVLECPRCGEDKTKRCGS